MTFSVKELSDKLATKLGLQLIVDLATNTFNKFDFENTCSCNGCGYNCCLLYNTVFK